MKYSTKSYKDKRRVEHSREECLVFKDTHPALITQEVWDICLLYTSGFIDLFFCKNLSPVFRKVFTD